MKRTIFAFLLAPLWFVPAALLLSVDFPWPVSLMAVGFHTVVGYIATLLFGLPGYLFLRRRSVLHLPIALVLGFVAGAVMRLVYLGFYTIIMPECDWQDAFDNVAEAITTYPRIGTLLVPGIFGSLIGASLWAILRPTLTGPSKRPS
jgi:hypothetical protein